MKLIEEIRYRNVESGKKLTDIETLLEGMKQWAPVNNVIDFYFEVDENDDVVLFANLKMYIGNMKTRSDNYFQIETAILDKRKNTVYCLANSEGYTSYDFLNGLPFFERHDFESLGVIHGEDAHPSAYSHYHHQDLLNGSFKYGEPS